MKQIYKILNGSKETEQPVINEAWLLKLKINALNPHIRYFKRLKPILNIQVFHYMMLHKLVRSFPLQTQISSQETVSHTSS